MFLFLKKLSLHLDSKITQLCTRFLAETGLSCFTCSFPCVDSFYKGTCLANSNFQCTFYCTEVVPDHHVTWFWSNSLFLHCLETDSIFKLLGIGKQKLTFFLLFFRPALADNWYSLSYLYFSTLGTLITVVVGIIVSLLTGTSSRVVIKCVLDILQTNMARELSLLQEMSVTLLQTLHEGYRPKSHILLSALLHPTHGLCSQQKLLQISKEKGVPAVF